MPSEPLFRTLSSRPAGRSATPRLFPGPHLLYRSCCRMGLGRKRISVCFFRGSLRNSSRLSTYGACDVQVQLTLMSARMNSKNRENTPTAVFWAAACLNLPTSPRGTAHPSSVPPFLPAHLPGLPHLCLQSCHPSFPAHLPLCSEPYPGAFGCSGRYTHC